LKRGKYLMEVFEKVMLGPLKLKNRLFSAPVKTGYGQSVTDRHVAYYSSIANGGVSLAYVEPIAVLPNGREHPKQLRLDCDDFIPSVAKIIETIHEGGALACVHLNHAGRAANPKVTGGVVISSSESKCPVTGATARAITKEEISEMVNAFKENALRAKKAGADAIEIQMGHGYIVSQFYSKDINHRDDEYADPLRFASEVLDAVKEAELPIIIRVSGDEMYEGGLHAEDLRDLLNLVEEKGVVAVHVGMGNACNSPAFYYHHMFVPKEIQEDSIKKIHAMTNLPVIAVGRFGDPERIQKALFEGWADFFALGRPLVADPEFPNKFQSGREDEITYCGGCVQGCLAKVKSGEGLGCIVNPKVGWPSKIEKSSKKKRIAIFGGGPAGLEAALVLKERGYEVKIFEKSDKLGGAANLAYKAFGKETMEKPIDSLINDVLRSSEISVEYGSDYESVETGDFDEVLYAVGSSPIKLNIPGGENILQITGHDYFSNPDVLKDKNNILIVGGGMIGVEAADHLVNNGKSVTVVEMLSDIARDMEPITRTLTLKRLRDKNVEVLTDTKLERFENGQAVCSNENGEISIGTFDAIIFTVGVKPNPSPEGTYKIGDADHPGQIYDAVHSGFEAGLKL
jgi:2,4-dienoyl-CoA reductase-like NADH-dependent reductase (Old Yellow Enzyme family)/thioredoxin reductase